MQLDFYTIRESKKGTGDKAYILVWADFLVDKHDDLMIRAGGFYAIWDSARGLWSTDLYDLRRLVDSELSAYADELRETSEVPVRVRYLLSASSNAWRDVSNYLLKLPDNYTELDKVVAFQNSHVTKLDYISKRVPYSLAQGPTMAFDTLFGTLYDPTELTKIKWVIGSLAAGESTTIQKFYVLYGAPGSGKSTTLNLIEQLFEGHTASFEAASMVKPQNAFALEALKTNPLVAIDHEGDLSKINTNSLLNSVVSHDLVVVNAKFKRLDTMRPRTTLFVASNKPVRITDVGSGLTRRLVDINPTGVVLPVREYKTLVKRLSFELGAIAYECLKVYRQLGIDRFDSYVATDMMMMTNHLFNFIHDHALEFESDNMITLKRAWIIYKTWCDEVEIKFRFNRNEFRDHIKPYWKTFHDRKRLGDKIYRSLFMGYKSNVFQKDYNISKGLTVEYDWLALDTNLSAFDRDHKDQPAQLASGDGTPQYKWDSNIKSLKDIETTKLHYVLPKHNLITIDFDLKDEEGNKSLPLNIAAARMFPQTYAETSKSGKGLHLYYFYDGDVETLSRVYDLDIEVIPPVGLTSIRRMLYLCNELPIATINSGLPLKPVKGDDMATKKTVGNERALRKLILRNLHKEIHPGTKPSVDFINTILDEAHASGLRYDVVNMKPHILNFASNSTNHAEACVTKALAMKYVSDHEEPEEAVVEDGRLIFFDVEVYPNLLLICWKLESGDAVIRMINPTAEDVEELLKHRLVGYNNRRYDNHILYARYLGYDNEAIYNISRRIVEGDRTAYFREAYGLSYADIYDFSTKKQSLKHWEVELGLPYSELDIPWDEPVSEKYWDKIGDYCENDVLASEAVFEERIADFHAREILAEISGLNVNDTTQRHAARIIFGKDRDARSKFIYPDLSEEFPGYVYDSGKSTYRGEVVGEGGGASLRISGGSGKSTYRDEVVGEGGYVYSEPGMYNNVLYMDVASMHPASIEIMNIFGPYTHRYSDLKKARILIKEGELDKAGEMFNGKLSKYLGDPSGLDGLSYALKIALNTVYGFTAAKFDNPFLDIRNVDNVVAKRGALFMVDIRHALIEKGIKAVHFKTDSVKIADYKEEDIEFITEFGRKYGYDFGVEGIFDKMVLINDAVLVGRWEGTETWEAVGARFAHPYVYKKLFTKEPIEFEDLVETRSVRKGNIYLEKEKDVMTFIGRIGTFCPMRDGSDGGTLYRVDGDKKHAVAGTKGYSWLPSAMVKTLGLEDNINLTYFDAAVEEALTKIAFFGDTTIFLGD